MSRYHIEQVHGLPAIVGTIYPDWKTAEDLTPFMAELSDLLDVVEQPVYYIVDMIELHLSLEDLMASTNMALRGEGAPLRHPNLAGIIMVTQSRFMEIAARGVNSEAFGFTSTKVFSSLDEALDYVRSQR